MITRRAKAMTKNQEESRSIALGWSTSGGRENKEEKKVEKGFTRSAITTQTKIMGTKKRVWLSRRSMLRSEY
jgi:hypothetical protein